jgi:hypothetical protein
MVTKLWLLRKIECFVDKQRDCYLQKNHFAALNCVGM